MKNMPETDLKITFSGFRLVTTGDYRGKVNSILEGLIKQYHELLNSGDSFTVKVVFVHETLPPVSRKYVENFNKEFPDVQVEFFSIDRLKQAYLEYLTYQDPAPDRVLLEIVGKIMRNDDKPKSVIFTISGKSLANVFLTQGTKIFQRNIRYLLAGKGKRAINSQIQATAADPEKSKRFWYFNNGITIICSHLEIPPNEQVVILNKMQIINGAQTTYSITNSYNANTLQDSTKVLVKVIESSDNDFIDEVTLYTNSQNPVNLRDLSSRDSIQTQIQKVFKSHGYFYERKRGEFSSLYPTEGIREKEFSADWKKKVMNNEKVAQAYLALFLNRPAEAKAQKSRIFLRSQGGFYNDIFNENLVEERMLLAYKLLEFIEEKTKEYSKEYYFASDLSNTEKDNIYSYDYLLHSNFFILNLFKDFLEHSDWTFDGSGCVKILEAINDGSLDMGDIYDRIIDPVKEFISERRRTDMTYYHTKFFKSETSIGLIRNYLNAQPDMDFIRLI